MGIELDRFVSDVEDEFLCPICKDVLEKAVRINECEHMFCRECLDQWMTDSLTCPVDRNSITPEDIRPPNRMLAAFLDKLQLRCEFDECRQIITLSSLNSHVNECIHNPGLTKPCIGGCGSELTKAQVASHKCIQALAEMFNAQMSEMKSTLQSQQAVIACCLEQIHEQQSIINQLKKQVANLMSKESNLKTLFDYPMASPEHLELIRLLAERNAIKSQLVKDAMSRVDRSKYCQNSPFEDRPQRLVPHQVTISAPHMHGYCLELVKDHLDGREDARVLDVGSGSGYLTVCLALMAHPTAMVVGIERIEELAEKSEDNIDNDKPDLIESERVLIIAGDGKNGYREKGPYDVIHVGAAVAQLPQELLDQLKIGGRMVIPIGNDVEQHLETIDKLGTGRFERNKVMAVRFGNLV